MQEEQEIPSGYAMVGPRKMMATNTRLPRIERGESMFRQGQGFQPAPNGAGLGQVHLHKRGGAFDRPAFVGQLLSSQVEMAQASVKPQTSTPSTSQPSMTPLPLDEQEVKRHPAMRLAWGRLKKKDAQELAAALADIIARMRAKGIPPGMVAQIQARLANFAASAQEGQEIEITEHEVQRMEAEILSLEEAEAKTAPDGSPNWLIAVGVAIGIGLLIDLIAD